MKERLIFRTMGQATINQMRTAAERFFESQPACPAPAALPALLDRATTHLMDLFRIDGIKARELAQGAWAEIDGRRTGCFVDLEMSTPHLVVLVDPVAGVRRLFPVADLVRMLGPRALASKAS